MNKLFPIASILVLLSLASATAFGQTMTTFTVVNNANVAAGTTTSGALDLTTLNPAPTQFMRFNGLLSAADVADPTLTMTGMLQGLFDGVWVDQVGFDWQGGMTDRQGNPVQPWVYYEPSAGLFPTKLRVVITLSRRTRMTVTVDVQ